MVRLLLADDHEVVREGVRNILQSRPDWEVVAEAADGKEAVRKAIETNPDVAIVDYSLPLMNGIEVTLQIRSRLEGTEVLIYTMHETDIVIEQLLAAGACGYLLKSDTNKSLIEAVVSLANHEPYFTGKVSATLLRSFLAQPKSGTPISGRERSVVQLIAEGYTNKEVGELLHISLKTVESHRASVMRKLELSSSAALVRYAIRNRIIEP
jgi:DNA-binding NarL/FixJ family response regulator